ncbi:hypothetical protein HYZ64_02360, partial [Candidatus Berkelbacteria bacterium]|nr:hypothetical protein [Candidatus Berkelbacteria bacterium]
MLDKGAAARKTETFAKQWEYEKSPLRPEGGGFSRETAMAGFERSLKENKYRVHAKEFEEDLRSAPVVEIKGFTRPGRLEKYRELNQKLAKRKEEIKKLEELRRKPGVSEEEIDEQEKKLDKLTQELFSLHGEAKPSLEHPILDDDEIRLMVKKVVPAHLREFFEKHCKIEYDPDLKEDQLQVADAGKIVFRFGPRLVKLEKQGDKLVPRVDKVMFQLGRMVGGLLTEPSAWSKYVAHVRILQNKAPNWEDFVALWLTDPTYAEKIAPEGAKAVKKVIENLKTATSANELRKQLNPEPGVKKFDTKFEFAGENYIGLWGRAITFAEKIRGFREEFSDRAWAAFREFLPYKRSDWYERTLVEFEDKEVSKILARDEHVTDRHKRLKTFFENHDEFGARTLIKSMAHTGDSRWWIYHMYLMQFDPLYRKTKGEEISRENYSFIVQNLRISHVGRRHGTKPGEYAPEPAKFPGAPMRIKRISRELWEERARDEIDKRSARDLLAVAQEAYEWMECEGADGNTRNFEIDEVFGDPDNKPLNLGVWEGGRDQWQEETNNFLRLLNEDFIERLNRNTNQPRFKNGKDKSQGWFKLDPDQVLMLARLVALNELFRDPKKEFRGVNYEGAIRDPFNSEHFKLAQKRAVTHYSQRAKEYRARLEQGGEHIAAYDRFLEYIDYYKEKELGGVIEASKAEFYDPESAEAEQII